MWVPGAYRGYPALKVHIRETAVLTWSVATRSKLQHPGKLTQTEGSSSHPRHCEKGENRAGGGGTICGRKPDPRPAWRSAAQGVSERKKGVHAKGQRASTVHPKKTGFGKASGAVTRPCSLGKPRNTQVLFLLLPGSPRTMRDSTLPVCRAKDSGLDPMLVLGLFQCHRVVSKDSVWCCERPPSA